MPKKESHHHDKIEQEAFLDIKHWKEINLNLNFKMNKKKLRSMIVFHLHLANSIMLLRKKI